MAVVAPCCRRKTHGERITCSLALALRLVGYSTAQQLVWCGEYDI